jgi:hypothetical protein
MPCYNDVSFFPYGERMDRRLVSSLVFGDPDSLCSPDRRSDGFSVG